MRQTILFENQIDIESVSQLIEQLPIDIPTDLFFCTEGGIVKDMRALIHHLNKMEDVVIYLTGEIASAGTLLLTECNKELVVTDDLTVMLFHQIDLLTYNLRQTDIEKKIVKICKADNKAIADKFLENGILTHRQVNDYNKGKDVILDREEVRKLKIFQK